MAEVNREIAKARGDVNNYDEAIKDNQAKLKKLQDSTKDQAKSDQYIGQLQREILKTEEDLVAQGQQLDQLKAQIDQKQAQIEDVGGNEYKRIKEEFQEVTKKV